MATMPRSSIVEIAQSLRHKEISPVDLTKECLAKIEQQNSALNAYITVTADEALAEARLAEAEIARGNWRGPLHGIPLGLKDLIDVAGVSTTAASAQFQNRVAREDSEVVRRLKRAGAILLGKQNLHECAYGGSSLISRYGEVRNPWNPAHIAGGSSGGSAAAVAAGLCWGAIGTDTAGSVREPAALCGVVGLKPTYGRVSVRGIVPLSLSLDHAGPIALCVRDAAAILQAIAGYDENDPNSPGVAVADYSGCLHDDQRPLRVAVPHAFFENIDAEVAAAVEEALRVLGGLGTKIEPVDLSTAVDRTLQSAEAYSWHAEFVSRSPELYDPETLRRIKSGATVTAAQAIQGRQDLQRARREIAKIFQRVDAVVTPTTPEPAPSIAELSGNLDQLRPRELTLLRNTRPFNVWGLPAISLPCGFTRSGLPIGLQIAAGQWEEARVLQVAHAYEQATEWHKRQMPGQ
jgi:aspartyl-tRNA(Asn)/glutamyl-tRNA(Gln) amidotransferase subunit A